MACKIIFSDIDGTLLNREHHIGRRTREKILELDKQGIPFILVSARMPDGVRLVQQELGNRRPIICYSGGLVLDEDGKVLDSCQMNLALAEEVVQFIKENYPEICSNIYSQNQWIVEDKQNPLVLREERITKSQAIAGKIKERFSKTGGIHKILFMGEVPEIAQAETVLKAKFPQLSVLRSNENYLEIMDGTVKKSRGVHVLCQFYGISEEEAAAFGDGENDVDMFQSVKYSYAMGNASAYVQEKASAVTLSNDDEGIYAVIREW